MPDRKENPYESEAFAVTLAAASALAATARAQDVIVVPGEVDSYVAEQPFDETITYDGDIAVGTTLPEDVIIREVPEYDDYSYAIVNRQRVIVEPRTRKIIKVYQ